MLRRYGFTFEYVVKKKPKGIRIICEMTQEEMSAMIEKAHKKHTENQQ